MGVGGTLLNYVELCLGVSCAQCVALRLMGFGSGIMKFGHITSDVGRWKRDAKN